MEDGEMRNILKRIIGSYFTFDAAQAQVGKIFNEHPTARGLIMPQNIADSATSSFMQLGDEPNLYAFPESAEGKFMSRWNTFSNTSQIHYENDKFGEENPYGFTFNLTNGGNTISYSFSRDAQQGPSLDYLLSLTLAAKLNKPFNNVLLPSKCLDLGYKLVGGVIDDLKTNPPFLDIKRAGDGDQADGASIMDGILKYVVLVTGDRLLSVQARLMNLRCILQYHQTLTIFKGIVPGANATAIAKDEAERIQRFIERYKKDYNTIKDPKFLKKIETFAGAIEVTPRPAKMLQVVQTLLFHKLTI